MTVRVRVEQKKSKTPGSLARTLSGLRWTLLLFALVTLGYTAYMYADAWVYQAYEDWSFNQELDGRTPSVAGFLKDQVRASTAEPVTDLGTPAPAAAEKKQPRKRVAKYSRHSVKRTQPRDPMLALPDKSIIGRIEIPRLRLHAMVREGADDATLRRAVGHVPGTAEPGAAGNMGLAGHRDSFFRDLHGVRKNDIIVLETLAAKYKYEVESLKIVGPDDIKVLDPTKHAVMTLITCYPFRYLGHAPRRFIVRARQIGIEFRESAPKAEAGS